MFYLGGVACIISLGKKKKKDLKRFELWWYLHEFLSEKNGQNNMMDKTKPKLAASVADK